jgi:hypothetical protein
MDENTQQNHLKAYGLLLVFRKLQNQLVTQLPWWFFLVTCSDIRKECQIRASFEVLSDGEEARILDEISSPSQNMETVILEKAPRIAVYTPKGSNFGMMRLHLF